MVHVLMSLGNHCFIESNGDNVFKKCTIKDIENMQSGKEYNGGKIYLGSFLNKPETIQGIRTFFKAGVK